MNIRYSSGYQHQFRRRLVGKPNARSEAPVGACFRRGSLCIHAKKPHHAGGYAVVHSKLKVLAASSLIALVQLLTPAANAQQTLGAIVGTVSDATGSVLPNATITAVADGTNLTRTTQSSSSGSYALQNLPIGSYSVTISGAGFTSVKFPGINIQADRTVTLPATLAVGSTNESVTVEATPLLNAVDTTNGYVLDKAQIEAIPLPTGSFTGLAILSPGVNAELPSGTGALSGLGNSPIWANGQRDTSNSFSLNGVDASNLFNGKSTSNVGSARVVNSTGVSSSTGAAGVIQSSASIYLSIGNAIPTPAPETIQEVHVNASMYDAQQGSTSGAHIDLSTSTGTNSYHGQVYVTPRHQRPQRRALLLQERRRYPGEQEESPAAPLHRRRNLRRTHHQGQALRLRRLPAPSGLRLRDRRLLPRRAGRSLSDTTRDAAIFAPSSTTSTAPRSVQATSTTTALALFNSPALTGQPASGSSPTTPARQPLADPPLRCFPPGTGSLHRRHQASPTSTTTPHAKTPSR